jgi:hypothetical protein
LRPPLLLVAFRSERGKGKDRKESRKDDDDCLQMTQRNVNMWVWFTHLPPLTIFKAQMSIRSYIKLLPEKKEEKKTDASRRATSSGALFKTPHPICLVPQSFSTSLIFLPLPLVPPFAMASLRARLPRFSVLSGSRLAQPVGVAEDDYTAPL